MDIYEFLGNCWMILISIYQVVHGGGYVGCLVAFVSGIFLSKRGVKLNGRSESYTGPVTNGIAHLRRNPAIEGTAKSWLGRLVGSALQLAGTILMIIAIIAFVNVLLYGEPKI